MGELEDLQQQNYELGEQVKLLVKTEKRLYAAQREIEHQLTRFEALNAFALVAPAARSDSEIVTQAFALIAGAIPLTAAIAVVQSHHAGALALQMNMDGSLTLLRAEQEADLLQATQNLPHARGVYLLDGASAELEPLRNWLDARVPGLDASARNYRRSAFLLTLRDPTSAHSEHLYFRSETVSYHERVASDEDRTFLELAARHIQAALTLARATGVLEERTTELADANRELEQRFDELRKAQGQLVEASRRTGMAEVATAVLHNVGNVLNSVNVSAGIVESLARRSKASGLGQAAALLRQQADPAHFLLEDARGQRLAEYFTAASEAVLEERQSMLIEIAALRKGIDHISVIVRAQQSTAHQGGLVQRFLLSEVLDDAVAITDPLSNSNDLVVSKAYAGPHHVQADRDKLLQIVVNLLSNARQAVREQATHRSVRLSATSTQDGQVVIEVEDSGVGIPHQHLEKIFNFGFTTKKDGHGYGLHSSACAAVELGGTLSAHSEGPGRGARFTLKIPVVSQLRSVAPASSRAAAR